MWAVSLSPASMRWSVSRRAALRSSVASYHGRHAGVEVPALLVEGLLADPALAGGSMATRTRSRSQSRMRWKPTTTSATWTPVSSM